MFTLKNRLFCVHFGVVVNAASQCCGRYVYCIWILILFGIMCGDDATFDSLCARKINGHGKHLVPIRMYKTPLTIRYNTNPKWCALSSINGIMWISDSGNLSVFFYHEKFPRSSKKMFFPPQRFFLNSKQNLVRDNKQSQIKRNSCGFCCTSVRIDDMCWIYPVPATSPPRFLQF